jgi:hypothetical protein
LALFAYHPIWQFDGNEGISINQFHAATARSPLFSSVTAVVEFETAVPSFIR